MGGAKRGAGHKGKLPQDDVRWAESRTPGMVNEEETDDDKPDPKAVKRPPVHRGQRPPVDDLETIHTDEDAEKTAREDNAAGSNPDHAHPGRKGKLEFLDEMRHDAVTQHQHEEEVVKETELEEEGLGRRAVDSRKAATDFNFDKASPFRKMCYRLLTWWGFDVCIGTVIMVNGATIGIATDYSSSIPIGCNSDCICKTPGTICHVTPAWVSSLEFFFLAVYVIELALRFYVFRWRVIRSNWVKFDCFLVVNAIVDVVLANVEIEEGSAGAELLGQVMLVRLVRLARLARAVRLMVQFQVLWMLVQGLMHSVTTLIWTFVMVMVLIYIFAVLGMELILVDENLPLDHPYNVAVTDNFRDIGDAIMSLIQAFSWDSISGIYRPIMKHRPYLLFYFAAVLLLLSIALMNLVTAIMVEGSLAQADEDKETKKVVQKAKKKKQMEQLKIMFEELDEDGSGELTMDEIDSAPPEVRDNLVEIAGTDDIGSLFEMLDYDGGGTVGTDEFCEGVIKATSSDKPMELTRLIKQNSDILANSRQVIAILRGDPLDEEEEGDGDNEDKPPPPKKDDKPVKKKNPKITALEDRIGNMERTLTRMQADVQNVLQATMKMMVSSSITANTNMKRAIAVCHGPVGTDDGNFKDGSRSRGAGNRRS